MKNYRWLKTISYRHGYERWRLKYTPLKKTVCDIYLLDGDTSYKAYLPEDQKNHFASGQDLEELKIRVHGHLASK